MNNSVKQIEALECVGCGSCYNICPRHAISLISDDYGFYYPEVDNKLCINCGACLLSCPINEHRFNLVKQVYAVSLIDKSIKNNSSSGGAFYWIASYVIEHEGVVYGASFSFEDRIVKHIRVDSKAQLCRLQNSKYVQSYIGDIYKLAKEDLSKGKIVLFSGTPCQVAGAYAYLGHGYDRFFTCDILCYGVPSPLVLSKYLNETIGDERIVAFNMRDKTDGWKNYSMHIATEKSDYLKGKSYDIYHLGFQSHIFYRSSCYSCLFRKKDRVGDFSLGDFWNYKESFHRNSIRNDDTGISYMAINTTKGINLFNQLDKNEVRLEKRSLEDNKDNYGFRKGMEISPERDAFFGNLIENGYSKAIMPHIVNRDYGSVTTIRRIYRWLKKNYYFRFLLHKLGVPL